jgi:hypothetical protein
MRIIDYGHCWIDYDGVPSIADNKTSFGQTNLKSLTITSTVQDFTYWTRYYGRAYIITDEGTIYDETYYFPSK